MNREALDECAELVPISNRIRDAEQAVQAARDEQEIRRTYCDELIDAIEALGGGIKGEDEAGG